MGKLAFRTGDAAYPESERELFFQGYAYTGGWERAPALTLEAIYIDELMDQCFAACGRI